MPKITSAKQIMVHAEYALEEENKREKVRVSSLDFTAGWFEAVSESGAKQKHYFKDYNLAPPEFPVPWQRNPESKLTVERA